MIKIKLTKFLYARLLGPALGYVTGAQVLRRYVYPGEKPDGLTPLDPRWVGAWWLGCVVISSLLFVVSPLIAFFPSRYDHNTTITSMNFNDGLCRVNESVTDGILFLHSKYL